MSVVDRNPCPKCGGRPHLMAGTNVPGIAGTGTYLVCWECNAVRDRTEGSDWVIVTKKKQNKTQWTKHTAHHWSTTLDGKRLDYWPTKRKWQFDGAIMSGDVNRFIKQK